MSSNAAGDPKPSVLFDVTVDVVAMVFEFLNSTSLNNTTAVCTQWKRIIEFYPNLQRIRKLGGLYTVGGMPRLRRSVCSNFCFLPMQSVPHADSEQPVSNSGWTDLMEEWENLAAMPNPSTATDALEKALENRIENASTRVPTSTSTEGNMIAVWHSCIATFDRKVFVIGGRDNDKRFDTAMYFDAMKSEWHILPRMREHRSACAAYAHGGYVYVLGGYDGEKEKDSVEILDTRTMQWLSAEEASAMMPPMMLACTEHTCCGFGDFLYVVCGTQQREQDDESTLSVTQFFNFKTRKWALLPTQNTNRLTACAFVHQGRDSTRLVVFGGGTEQNERRPSVETLKLDRSTGLPEAAKTAPMWSMMNIANTNSCSSNQFCAANGKRLVWLVGNGNGIFAVDLEKGTLQGNGVRRGGDGNWLDAIINAQILHAVPAPFEAGKILFLE